jgi:hypothetical protein
METSAQYGNSTTKIIEAMNNPAASIWFISAMQEALKRDPVDAANEARLLSSLLDERLEIMKNEMG